MLSRVRDLDLQKIYDLYGEPAHFSYELSGLSVTTVAYLGINLCRIELAFGFAAILARHTECESYKCVSMSIAVWRPQRLSQTELHCHGT